MGIVINGRERFAKRRAELVVRRLRFMRDRIEMTGVLLFVPQPMEIVFAIRELPNVIDKARRERTIPLDDDGRYDPAWLTPMLNLFGDMYDDLDTIWRDQLLRCVLGFLDRAGATCAQAHVRRLRNPQLIADIALNRHDFMPSIQDEADWLSRHPTVVHLWPVRPEEINTFWHCLPATMRGEWISHEARLWYYDTFPYAVERTIDFLATLAHDRAAAHAAANRTSMQDAVDQVLDRFDYSLHGRIRERMKERKWTKL